MLQVVRRLLNVRVRLLVNPLRRLERVRRRRLPLDPLKARRPNPALVLANVYVRPFAERFTDGHFGALVNGEEVGA